jgi:YggT family protein
VVAEVVVILTWVLSIAVFARAILTWFSVDPSNPLVDILVQITEPILAPIRSIMPRTGFIDLTPMVAIILLNVIGQIVVRSV